MKQFAQSVIWNYSVHPLSLALLEECLARYPTPTEKERALAPSWSHYTKAARPTDRRGRGYPRLESVGGSGGQRRTTPVRLSPLPPPLWWSYRMTEKQLMLAGRFEVTRRRRGHGSVKGRACFRSILLLFDTGLRSPSTVPPPVRSPPPRKNHRTGYYDCRILLRRALLQLTHRFFYSACPFCFD